MQNAHAVPMLYSKRNVLFAHAVPIQFAFFFLLGLTLYVCKYSVNYVFML